MLRLSDHAIKMMEQRLRLEQHRTYQANKIVDNLHHKYFFQHIFQPKKIKQTLISGGIPTDY
ncbi:hypothetical protein ACT7DJ_33135 [Bacillus cereus]